MADPDNDEPTPAAYDDGVTLLGMNAATYYAEIPTGTGGSSSLTWIKLENITGFNLDASSEEADSTTRASGGIKTTEPTLITMGGSFTMNNVEGDAAYAFFRARFLDKGVFLIKDLDRPDSGDEAVSGANGWRLAVRVKSFKETRDLADIQKAEVELTISNNTQYPPRPIVNGTLQA